MCFVPAEPTCSIFWPREEAALDKTWCNVFFNGASCFPFWDIHTSRIVFAAAMEADKVGAWWTFETWGKQERRKVSNRKSMICSWSLVLLGVGQQFQLWSFNCRRQGLGVSRLGCRHDLETDIVPSYSIYQNNSKQIWHTSIYLVEPPSTRVLTWAGSYPRN